jgi:heme exporter protein A
MFGPMTFEVRNLTLQRGNRVLVKDFNLALRTGEGVCVRGPNGSGKTTLLRAMAGFHTPLSGEILGNTNEEGVPCVSFLGHQDPIKAGEKLGNQLKFWGQLAGQNVSTLVPIAQKLGLLRQLDLPSGVLSAGQRRRASLARLLIEDRLIWLLDEPSAPLDNEGRALLGGLLDAHREKGGIFIAAVHDDLPGQETQAISLGVS